MRKTPFVNGELYHIFNRGVDKRSIYRDIEDVERFLESIKKFNSLTPIGSLYELSFNSLGGPTAKSDDCDEKLVEVICYCLNPNHFHLILEQVADRGISEFMKRLSGGYAWHFNDKYKRSGALFEGKFKSVHVSSNEQLLYVSAYVNLNNYVHQLSGPTAKLVRSSWDEYKGLTQESFCKKDIVLGQFKNAKEYEEEARQTVEGIIERRYDIDEFLLE
ncbi:transposase [Patescibacteria group bacterium]|nr:transposase [Patescibacteria group bacterium]